MSHSGTRGFSRALGFALIALWAIAALLAPVLTPHAIDVRFADLPNAPPTRPHVVDDAGSWHAPFIYRWTLVNRLEQVPHVKAAVGTVIAPVSGLLSVTGLDLPAFASA